jgi:hypothetical protein
LDGFLDANPYSNNKEKILKPLVFGGIRFNVRSSQQNPITFKDVDRVNPVKWWKEMKKLCGQNVQQEWYHQFLDNNMDIESLANKVNDFFVSLTDHFTPLSQPTLPMEIPEEFLVTESEVFKALSSLQINKAIGPDNITNRILKEFAPELAPVIRNIYNQSMKEANIPSPLKSSIVIPIPKISPPQTIENDIRPISRTSSMAKSYGRLYLH